MVLQNGWPKYWERAEQGGNYYGKHGANSDLEINILNITKKDILLDIGCANGAILTDIRKKTGAIGYGIDISPIPLKLNKDKKLKLKVADMEKTGYPGNTFTKVISRGVFEHTPRTEKVFLELNRIMKRGGLAFITVPNKISFFHLTKNFKMIIRTWDLGYERSFSKKEIDVVLKKTGFKLERYYIIPHSQVSNIFNWGDNQLNKINKNYFGFFIYFTARKIKDVA
ncbi:Ubiquinone biosynthesis O-methyltransferase [uncultured archaeon]|nr:Ubiquinone biosynthesis O-methyltransferase [uncultured archaeon]